MVDQITIFNDVPKAQEWFRLLRSSDGSNEDVINFEEEELVLGELTKLSLVNLRLRGIEILSLPFERIQYLNLSFNRISELSGLSHLTSLKTLDFSHNRVVELEPLRNLKDLEIIRCDYNIIETLEPLYDTTQLNQLWLSNNRIKWEELIYLTPLNKLKIINLSDNPLEKKPKIYEFLCSLKPFILFINGSSKKEFSEKMTENTDKLGDFFRSPDGKVMLTRARAYFKASNTSNLNKDRLNKSIKNSTTDFGGDLTQAIDLSIYSNVSPTRNKISNPMRSNKNTKFVDDDYTGSDRTPTKIQDDQNKNRSRSPLPSNDEADSRLNSQSNTPDKISSRVTNNDNHVRSSTIIKDDNKFNDKNDSKQVDKHLTPSHNKHDVNDHNKCPIISMGNCEEQIIRFGGNDEDLDAIVAFNLNSDKSGYVRWTKSGPIACSLEGGRLLSSYKSGSIAAMLDAAGNGSIMDPKGRCLLVMTQENGGVVKILDKSGNNIAVYEKDKIQNQQQSESEGKEQKKIKDIKDKFKNHVWNFDGLKLEFDVQNWQVCDLRCVLMYVYKCMYICIDTCIHIYVCVYIYIHVCI
jgi:hypothetical protein